MTTVGITNWLATTMTGRHIPKQAPTLKDILHHEKDAKNYRFISRYMTIYEAEEIFKIGVERGRPHQKLIGIVTPIDIMKVD